MSTARLVDVIVPVLARPHRAQPFLDSLWSTIDPDQVGLLVVADDTDTATVAAWSGRAPVLLYPSRSGVGSFPRKVNYGYGAFRGGAYRADWVLLVGDDVRFHPGWLDAALDRAAETGAQVVGTNDLGAPRVLAGEHTTHPLIARRYIEACGASWDGPGVVCHEGFRHSYVDDEVVLAAKQRDVWTFAANAIIEHLHPAFGKGETDGTYEIGAASMAGDQVLFEQRRAKYARS